MRYETAVGLDISEAMIAQARVLNEAFPQCEFRLNAAPDLGQFETGSFDFVYSSIVLQHLRSVADIERYVTEFLRVTRPGGVVVFGIPSHISFPYSPAASAPRCTAFSAGSACRRRGCCAGRR